MLKNKDDIDFIHTVVVIIITIVCLALIFAVSHYSKKVNIHPDCIELQEK